MELLEDYIETIAHVSTSYKIMSNIACILHAQLAPAQSSRTEASCLVQRAGYKFVAPIAPQDLTHYDCDLFL